MAYAKEGFCDKLDSDRPLPQNKAALTPNLYSNTIEDGVITLSYTDDLPFCSNAGNLSESNKGVLNEKYDAVNRDTQDHFSLNLISTRRISKKVYYVAMAAMVTAVANGFCGSYAGPATFDMQNRLGSSIKPNDDEVSWIASITPVGMTLGALTAGVLSVYYGRKTILVYNCVPFLIGWLLVIYGPNVAYLISGRFVTGISLGLIHATLPMYTIEISTPESRGLLGASFQSSIVIGSLIAMGLGAFLVWTWLAVAGLIIVVTALIFLCLIPESPRYLIAQNRRADAKAAINFLQGGAFDSELECQIIENDLKAQPKGSLTIWELFQPIIYKPALLSFGLMFFVQFCGFSIIIVYTSEVFNLAGSSVEPKISTAIVGLVQVVSTIFSSAIVDRAGRKVLLLISGFLMGVCLSILGGFFYISSENAAVKQNFGWVPLSSIIIFTAMFSLGYGPIPFMMISEMVPTRARSLVSGLSIFFTSILAFMVLKTFKEMTNSMQLYGTFWFYALANFFSCAFVWFLVPETKGKHLEEIQNFFIPKQKAIKIQCSQQSIMMVQKKI